MRDRYLLIILCQDIIDFSDDASGVSLPAGPKKGAEQQGRRAVTRLVLSGISKSYGAIQALSSVSLVLQPGEVLGLMGDNGAGKSTLVKIIAGNFPPSAGEMRIDGETVVFHKPRDAQRQGIEAVYQDLALCDNLSAASNVFLGREAMRSLGPLKYLNYRRMNEVAADLFRQLKSETRPRDLVRKMSGGQRQAVAIARTLLSQPKIVMMDEPTAAISVRQVKEVLDLIGRLRDHGISVILISHRMPDIFAVADRIAVLRRGELVASKPAAESSPEEVTGLITGAIDAA
ncbi:sugar ABC transporter ATP-binding protein [Methylobrevis sp. L22]|uniref:Sugar ABC transporter ATP-binding protein n=1 Tax=Methylobrevis albus TaxID=2793297 RepID=A0A931I1B9_9HYPH|nr:sugar ABC transporter ATP-binding protein [Methylobrevis albus]